jgi:acyl-CoA thioesterase
MKNGDAAVYKGCEREHWRDPLESKYNRMQRRIRKVRKMQDDTYHHQIFLHYVNSQGPFVHFANDR